MSGTAKPSTGGGWIGELSGVAAGYRPGIDVLTGLDLRIPPGCTLLTGPNGSGKSTVVELLAGTLRPTAGSVTVLGLPAGDAGLRARRTVCRAAPALYPALTPAEHRSLIGADHDAFEARARRHGLGPWLDTPIQGLSTGNIRKAWLLLTTMRPVELVVLDEPFNGLDPRGSEALPADIREGAGVGCSVTVVAHDPPAAFRVLVDSTVGIDGPEIARIGPR
ncbi:MAG: ATP-binding cassette domain-containing protein [Pseudonocardia sp.]|nr:ATP-binding cassette domain-containing protein [Pseudonocardia sp.]